MTPPLTYHQRNFSRKKCFVFGSNTEGRHGKGAALLARQEYGAVYGTATGLMGPGRSGYSYGIVTKELRRNLPPIAIDTVRHGVDNFLEFARSDEGNQYSLHVTEIGCGLAGFNPDQIGPLFVLVLDHHALYEHVELPPRFVQGIVNVTLGNGAVNTQGEPLDGESMGSDGTSITTWTVQDIINDLAAFCATFEWVWWDCASAREGDAEYITKQMQYRYKPTIETAVRMWRASFLTGTIQTIYQWWNWQATVPDIKEQVSRIHGNVTINEVHAFLDELERLGIIKADSRDWKPRPFPQENQ